jgi:hypothetical protein
MTVSSELLRQLSALPDWAVLTDQQTSQVLGLSVDTLRRLDRDRDGPPWVRLSPRRRGRPVGGLRKWIKQRVSASSHEPQMQASADTVSSLNETDAAPTCKPDAKVRLTADSTKTPRANRLQVKDQVPP